MAFYRIVLADDHRLMRQGIRRIIEAFEDLKIVGEADDGPDLLNQLKSLAPDLIILDISMPKLGWLEITRKARTIFPDIKILILSMHKNIEYLYHALAAGINGYLLKEDTDTELFSAIQTVRQGGVYVSPFLFKDLSADLLGKKGIKKGRPFEGGLTAREKEVLTLVAGGKSSKEIGAILSIHARTVQHHRASILKKLKLKKTADLVKYAIRKGYTSFTIL